MTELVTLRRATVEDTDQTFAWANDPVTRAVSFTSAVIPYDDHVAWFAGQLAREDRHLLIAECEGSAIALVRLDRTAGPSSMWVISINVAPDARGRGLGTATLAAATSHAATLGCSRIRALIRPDNVASIRAFTRVGYVQVGETTVADQPALVFER